ncbi:hypothetical protein DVH24_024009 [Malus domestica]|uniref:RNase H type-1 domain-containing protein n=1 Tax=Malus domestica TaxID=3750 RepID=A0A498JHE5_MALDO|nr:hypothetical protein DVH24_024009 [Malus domestica]
MAKATAVWAAMTVCLEEGLERVMFESDAQRLIQMINKECVVDASLEFFATKFNSIEFCYVSWDGNLAAHAMAYVANRGGSFCEAF